MFVRCCFFVASDGVVVGCVIVDCDSKGRACCTGITVPDEDAGTGHSVESSDS